MLHKKIRVTKAKVVKYFDPCSTWAGFRYYSAVNKKVMQGAGKLDWFSKSGHMISTNPEENMDLVRVLIKRITPRELFDGLYYVATRFMGLSSTLIPQGSLINDTDDYVLAQYLAAMADYIDTH